MHCDHAFYLHKTCWVDSDWTVQLNGHTVHDVPAQIMQTCWVDPDWTVQLNGYTVHDVPAQFMLLLDWDVLRSKYKSNHLVRQIYLMEKIY